MCPNCTIHYGIYFYIIKNTKFGVLHTSESLVACCHGKWALLHGQLVKLAELWGDSSRRRLWEWERRQKEEWRKQGNTVERKAKHTRQSIQTATRRTLQSTNITTIIAYVHNKMIHNVHILCCKWVQLSSRWNSLKENGHGEQGHVDRQSWWQVIIEFMVLIKGMFVMTDPLN